MKTKTSPFRDTMVRPLRFTRSAAAACFSQPITTLQFRFMEILLVIWALLAAKFFSKTPGQGISATSSPWNSLFISGSTLAWLFAVLLTCLIPQIASAAGGCISVPLRRRWSDLQSWFCTYRWGRVLLHVFCVLQKAGCASSMHWMGILRELRHQ